MASQLPAALLIAAGLVTATTAQAQVTPEKDRTVSFYADHDALRSRVLAACQNDPGHGFGNPDCTNASMAGITLLEREAAKHDFGANDHSPVSSPQFWRARPDLIRMRLPWCERMKSVPASWNALECGVMMSALR